MLAPQRTAAAAAALACLAGCAGYAPNVAKEEKPGANDAYLYGRFKIEAPKNLFGGSVQTMGFRFKCDDLHEYTLRFDGDEPLQVVKIAPSTCSMAEIVYTDAMGVVKSRKPAPAAMQKFRPFAAGSAYYLGDFFAETTVTRSGNMINREWHITNVVDDYDQTTQDMRSGYPNLADLPTEDRLRNR